MMLGHFVPSFNANNFSCLAAGLNLPNFPDIQIPVCADNLITPRHPRLVFLCFKVMCFLGNPKLLGNIRVTGKPWSIFFLNSQTPRRCSSNNCEA